MTTGEILALVVVGLAGGMILADIAGSFGVKPNALQQYLKCDDSLNQQQGLVCACAKAGVSAYAMLD